MSDKKIGRTEAKWKGLVVTRANELFQDHYLPSHDPGHHERVWRNACIYSQNIPINDPFYYEKLLLACYFHDLGMIFDLGEKHGRHSAQLCREFLDQYGSLVDFDTTEVLEAIEFHDDKEYQSSSHRSLVSDILSMADDLDAFGAIGVYRYIEIYLLRDIDTSLMAEVVLRNAAGRYKHLRKLCRKYRIVTKIAQSCYEILQKLLLENSYQDTPDTLITWIREYIVLPSAEPFAYMQNVNIQTLENQRVQFFVRQVCAELTR